MGNDPDWGRAGVTPPNKYAAVGDPTRWGATIVTTTQPIIDGVSQLLQSGQSLSVQCRDGYSRAWTLAGTINAPAELFGVPNEISANPADSYWVVAAYVSMGVGQVQIVHSFDVREILAADAPFYWNSDISNPFFENVGSGSQAEPFLINGALVGASMSVQILQRLQIGGSGNLPPFTITTSMILTPFDPGVQK